jgi:serine/threonine protein kinase
MTSTQTVLAGRYRLRAPIGQGGMGRVWLATDELLGRDVAVKELVAPPGFTEAEVREMGTRAVREARAAARLNHTNVVAVYDVVVEGNAPWIVMEYVRARSLYQVVADTGPLDVPAVARIGLAVLAALRAAHAAGVLHRDVKPGNVLITDENRVVLTDFGLATIVGDPAVTRSGVVIGSPSYMAPERARDGEAGPAADLWSLGATLYFAVEGHSPYERGSALATITALATEDPPPATRAGALRPVLRGLLRRAPGTRLDAAEAERMLRAAAVARVPRSRSGSTAPVPPADSPAPTELLPRPTAARPTQVGPARIGPMRIGPMRIGPVRIVAVLVLLTVLALAAVWIAHGRAAPDGSGPPDAAASSLPTAAAPDNEASATQPAGPVPSASVASDVLPPGWERYTDETGFSVAVPTGWSVSRNGTIVYFREPAGGRYFGIDQTDQPQPDPVADWTGKEAYRVARGDFPDYQRIRIEAVDYFQKAADWEFTYRVGDERVHVLNRGFITSPTRAYGMWWSTPDSQWSGSLDDLALVQRTFTPGSG